MENNTTLIDPSDMKKILFEKDSNVNWHIIDYLDSVLVELESFKITEIKEDDFIDDLVIEMIDKMLPLRNNFIDVATNIFKYGSNISIELFSDFLENLIGYQYQPKDYTGDRNTYQADHYIFFIKELFLYFITLLKNLKKIDEIDFFTKQEYFYKRDGWGIENVNFSIFNRHIEVLDNYRNSRLKLNRKCLSADIVKENLHNDFALLDIIETDIILYYILLINRNNWYQNRFPRTTVYNGRGNSEFPFFKRMLSANHCKKIWSIFDVDNIELLKEKMKFLLEKQGKEWVSHGYNIPKIDRIIEIEKIWTAN